MGLASNTATAGKQADCLESESTEQLLYKGLGDRAAAQGGPRLNGVSIETTRGARPSTPATPGLAKSGGITARRNSIEGAANVPGCAPTPTTPSASPQGGSAAETFAAAYQSRMTEARSTNPYGY